MQPWERDALYSECGQVFFTNLARQQHEDICGYCQRAKRTGPALGTEVVI
jgi:hypothetical protein